MFSPVRAFTVARTTSRTSCARYGTRSSISGGAWVAGCAPTRFPRRSIFVADPHARQPDAALEAAEVYGAIAALPNDLRDVIVAVDVAGLSYKEAARALASAKGRS